MTSRLKLFYQSMEYPLAPFRDAQVNSHLKLVGELLEQKAVKPQRKAVKLKPKAVKPKAVKKLQPKAVNLKDKIVRLATKILISPESTVRMQTIELLEKLDSNYVDIEDFQKKS